MQNFCDRIHDTQISGQIDATDSRIFKKNTVSQHQAGYSGPAVKRLKQTALTWKVKDKAASQLARSYARLTGRGVNQGGQGETVLKVLTEGGSSVDFPKVRGFGGTVRVLLRDIS